MAVFNRTAIDPGMYEAWKKDRAGKAYLELQHELPIACSRAATLKACLHRACQSTAKRSCLARRKARSGFFGVKDWTTSSFQPASLSGRVAVHAAVLARHDPEPFGCRVDRWARCVADLEGTRRRTSLPQMAREVSKSRHAPNWYLSDCGDEGTNFGGIGRRVASEIAKGKRWGAEIPLPK